MKRIRVSLFVGVAAILVAAQPVHADSPPTITHDVVFKVGTNSSINWFEIDNPSVGGTITVTNQPYANTDDLNTVVIDISRNRLMYVDDTGPGNPAYAINLTGLTLVPGAATSVTVSSLGDWAQGNDNAGYSKADGRVYYHVYNSIELRYLNFDASGNISGYTTVGNFNGASFMTQTIRAGDLDFDSSGNIWVSGINSGSDPRLWSFNPTTLTVITNKNSDYELLGHGLRRHGDDTLRIFGRNEAVWDH